MRACAEICKLALLVETYNLILGQVFYELDLIRLVLLFHKLYGIFVAELEALERQLFLYDFTHFLLDLFEYLGSEDCFGIEVVVKAVFYRRTCGKLCLGIETLYRLRQNMA